MKVDSIKLVGFRNFADFDLKLHPEMTVLVGANGSGKTAIVDALAIGLRRLTGLHNGPHIEERDRRLVPDWTSGALPVLSAAAQTSVDISAPPERWQDSLTPGGRHYSGAVTQHSDGYEGDLPVLASYGIDRAWRDFQWQASGPGTRFDGWKGWWVPSASMPAMVGWIRRQTYADLQQGTRLPHLEAILGTAANFLDELDNVWFDVRTDELRANFENGTILPLSMLSGGYRNILGLVLDLAWRAVTLNPQHGEEAPERSNGVVLIDEVDLHLHPAWQRRVLDDLRRTFPNIQFVVTTHSPQVIGSARAEWVRILDGDTVRTIDYTEGRDSNSLLEDVFRVPERSAEFAERLRALFEDIDLGRLAEARVKVKALLTSLGPDDPDLVRARWLIDTESP